MTPEYDDQPVGTGIPGLDVVLGQQGLVGPSVTTTIRELIVDRNGIQVGAPPDAGLDA